MNDWLFPATIFFLALVVWIFALLFTHKQTFLISTIVSVVVAGVSILILLHKGYTPFVGGLVCFLLLIVIVYFGFDIFLQKPVATGPLAEFMLKEGIAKTCLEPKGKVSIEDSVVAASSEGLFIPEGASIRVIRCAEKFLIVERIE